MIAIDEPARPHDVTAILVKIGRSQDLAHITGPSVRPRGHPVAEKAPPPRTTVPLGDESKGRRVRVSIGKRRGQKLHPGLVDGATRGCRRCKSSEVSAGGQYRCRTDHDPARFPRPAISGPERTGLDHTGPRAQARRLLGDHPVSRGAKAADCADLAGQVSTALPSGRLLRPDRFNNQSEISGARSGPPQVTLSPARLLPVSSGVPRGCGVSLVKSKKRVADHGEVITPP